MIIEQLKTDATIADLCTKVASLGLDPDKIIRKGVDDVMVHAGVDISAPDYKLIVNAAITALTDALHKCALKYKPATTWFGKVRKAIFNLF